MSKSVKRILALLLCLTLCASLTPAVYAEHPEAVEVSEATEETSTGEVTEETEVQPEPEEDAPHDGDSGSFSIVYVNPLYADSIDVSQIPSFRGTRRNALRASGAAYDTLEGAAGYLREQMKQRSESITVPYITRDEPSGEMMQQIFDLALEHTGLPTEGDYIRFQFEYYSASCSYSYGSGTYTVQIQYSITYFSDREQEDAMDAAVSKLLNELDLGGKSPYERLRSIYDWICTHVAYDYDNLDDDEYKLKYSAYAALIDRKAVCQGYAVLLYRLLLTEGIDCRVLSGIGNGGNHAWNIAGLDGKYYDLDATWDTGRSPFYDYFLRCEENFNDHKRKDTYSDEVFLARYPMSETDYACPETVVDSGACGADLTWTITDGGTLTISGSGAMTEAPWLNDYRYRIQKAVIQPGVTSICEDAFFYCDLESVTIPASVTEIGYYAFYGCDCLNDVYYGGTQEIWETIAVDEYNDSLNNATVHCTVDPADAVEVHYNVSVKDSFDVKIGVIVHDGYDPAKCTVQIGETGTPTPVTGRTHVAVIGSFPAKNLGDRLYICVRYEGEIVQEEYYSVKKYCEDMIAAGKNAELCQAVLDYGSYAQQYFKYNTAELANGGEFKTAQSTVPESENEKTDKNSGISDAKLNLSLESNLSMKAAFLPKDSDSLNGCRITVDGEQVTPEITSMGYIIKFGFKPAQVTKTFEIVVTTATGSYIFKVTPLAYLYSMSQKGDADLTNLCQALYTFAQTIGVLNITKV